VRAILSGLPKTITFDGLDVRYEGRKVGQVKKCDWDEEREAFILTIQIDDVEVEKKLGGELISGLGMPVG